MRWAAATLIALIAVLSLPLAATPARAASLSARLAPLVDGFGGGAAVVVADPATTQALFARDADREVIAASLYKLAILTAVEEQVERGLLRYSDTIVIEPWDITADGSFEVPGTELTVDEALEAMITLSDNGTAVHLWRALGGSAVNALLERSGVRGFHVATSIDDDNHVTAGAVAQWFGKVQKGELVSRAASQRMLARLGRQHIGDRIPAQLPEGTRVAHKTGNLPGLVHDAGIIFTPRAQRIVVAMTWEADDAAAREFIAHVASTVYSDAIAAPASARYRVPSAPQYVQQGSAFVMEALVENAGDEDWAPRGMWMTWELRDASNAVVARAPRPIDLGGVRSGGSTTVAVSFTAPARPGDHRLLLGLVDGTGRSLAQLGVATVTVPVRVHLPVVARTEVRVPSLMHRREASLLEVSYRAFDKVRLEDHTLALAWRFVDPATDRIVAQGRQALGTIKTYEEVGGSFAPLVAPNLRGTYRLEYEIVERGFLAGVAERATVEILGPRTFGDEAGPTSQQRRATEQQLPRPTATATPRPAVTPFIPLTTPRPVPRPSAVP
ncbi:MAG: serine hydrolase [Chloroflexi bacterium]|nr:serine hydrolase [Chloroflexota bacterium]